MADSSSDRLDHRLDRMDQRLDDVSQNVTKLTNTIHDGFADLTSAITKLALAALTKQDGFKSSDVLKLLAGIGLFTYGMLHGLEKLGLLQKFIE